MNKPVHHQGYDPQRFEALTFYDAVPSFLDGMDTPRAYLERCIDTIEAREPQVEAFVSMNLEGARKGADASTKRYRDKRSLSRVDGMPIGIKDLYETVDMPTQMGSPIFKDWHPNRDSAAVHALRHGGALIIGKTVDRVWVLQSGSDSKPVRLLANPGRIIKWVGGCGRCWDGTGLHLRSGGGLDHPTGEFLRCCRIQADPRRTQQGRRGQP